MSTCTREWNRLVQLLSLDYSTTVATQYNAIALQVRTKGLIRLMLLFFQER